MEKTQVYLDKDELESRRNASARSGGSIAQNIRDAVRKTMRPPSSEGPFALWDGELRRTSVEHDCVHDEP